MKNLVTLVLLFSVVVLPVFADDASTPVATEERTCKNSSCTCNPCECDPCACAIDQEIECCGAENCPHGDAADDNKNNK